MSKQYQSYKQFSPKVAKDCFNKNANVAVQPAKVRKEQVKPKKKKTKAPGYTPTPTIPLKVSGKTRKIGHRTSGTRPLRQGLRNRRGNKPGLLTWEFIPRTASGKQKKQSGTIDKHPRGRVLYAMNSYGTEQGASRKCLRRMRITRQGGHLTWAPESSTGERRQGGRRKGVCTHAKVGVASLIRRKNRTTVRIQRILKTDNETANSFVSINTPKGMSFIQQKEYLEASRKEMAKAFPACKGCFTRWFYGYGRGNKLHMHAVGYFGGISPGQVRRLLVRILIRLSPSLDDDAIDVRPYDRNIHPGYLARYRKGDELLLLLEQLGTSRACGTIHGQNITKAPADEELLTEAEDSEFRKDLAEQIVAAGLPKSNLYQLRKGKGSLSFIPEEFIENSLKKVKLQREE